MGTPNDAFLNYWDFNYDTGQWDPNPTTNPNGAHMITAMETMDPPADYTGEPADINWEEFGLMGGTGNDWWVAGVIENMMAENPGTGVDDYIGFIQEWNNLDDESRQSIMQMSPGTTGQSYGQIFNDAIRLQDERLAAPDPDDTPPPPPDPNENVIYAGPSGGKAGLPTTAEGQQEAQMARYQDMYDNFGRDSVEGFMRALEYWEDNRSGYMMGPRPPRPDISNYDFDFTQLRDSEKERLEALGYDPFWVPTEPETKGEGDPEDQLPGPDKDPDTYDVQRSLDPLSFQAQASAQSEGGKLYNNALQAGESSGGGSGIDKSLLSTPPTGKGTMFTSAPGTGISTAFQSARTHAPKAGQAQVNQRDSEYKNPALEKKKATWGGGWQ